MNDVERLLALEEIRQLAQRYSIYLDARDLDRLVELFTPDVRVGREARGRDALRANFDAQLRGVGITFLHVGNHAIELDPSGEKATGVVYCRGEIQQGGIDAKRWIVQAIQYHDRYVRHEGHWYFERRNHLLVYGADLGTNPLSLPPAHWPRSATGMGSAPHEFETWQRFWASPAGDAEPSSG
ncbi:MAG: nuclear transport factor 2 family protein [Myxococcota bacterium]